MAEQNKHEGIIPEKFSRRYFLEIIGVGSIGVAAAGSLALTAAYLSPNVVKEPATKFKIGSPDNYPPGSVTFVQDKKVYVVHTKEGEFYTLSATCTHLGCIANWKEEEGIIACPCHGSKFDRAGNVIHGPAPKPLPHYSITLDDQGLLVVDKSVVVGDEVVLKA